MDTIIPSKAQDRTASITSISNPRRCAPVQHSPSQLAGLQSMLKQHQDDLYLAKAKFREELAKLGTLTIELSRLQEAWNASKGLENSACILLSTLNHLEVLKLHLLLPTTAFESYSDQQLAEKRSATNLSMLNALENDSKGLQENISRYIVQNSELLREKLDYYSMMHDAQSKMVSKAKNIVNIHANSINELKAGPLNIINRLPRDILFEIFQYLEENRRENWLLCKPAKERLLLSVSQVCWYWREVSSKIGNAIYWRDGDEKLCNDMVYTQFPSIDEASHLKPLYIETAPPLTYNSRVRQYFSQAQQLQHVTAYFNSPSTVERYIPMATNLHMIDYSGQVKEMIVVHFGFLMHTISLRCTGFAPFFLEPPSSISSISFSSPLQHLELDTSNSSNPNPFVILCFRMALQLFTNLKTIRVICASFDNQYWKDPPLRQGEQEITAPNLHSFAISSDLVTHLDCLIQQGRLKIPNLSRLHILSGRICKIGRVSSGITHFQISEGSRFGMRGDHIRVILTQYEDLKTIEMDGRNASALLKELAQPLQESQTLVPSLNTIIITGWKENGQDVLDCLVARPERICQGNKNRLTVRFENCPNIEAPIRTELEKLCEYQWDPSCLTVNGWTTRDI